MEVCEFLSSVGQNTKFCSLSYVIFDLHYLASCFPQNIETEVGIIGACAGEVSVLKGPSSFSTFYSDSIFDLCTEVGC